MARYLHYAEFNKVTFDFMISPPEIKVQVVTGPEYPGLYEPDYQITNTVKFKNRLSKRQSPASQH